MQLKLNVQACLGDLKLWFIQYQYQLLYKMYYALLRLRQDGVIQQRQSSRCTSEKYCFSKYGEESYLYLNPKPEHYVYLRKQETQQDQMQISAYFPDVS